jgi:cytochrome c
MTGKTPSSIYWARAALAAMAVASTVGGAAAEVQSPAAQRGLTFARVHCAQCHAIDKVSESPLKIAPPLRALHLKYPIENLRRPLLEGVIANHPTMPVFRLDPGQASDVIDYLKSLE